MVLCACGCGQEVKFRNKYINGHNSRCMSSETKRKISKVARNRTYSEKTKKKMSESAKRKIFSKEHKKKISEAKKGNQCALGHKHSKKSLKRMSKSQKGNQNNKGHKHSEETKRKISKSNKGNIPSYKVGRGKGDYYDSPYQNRIYLRSSYEKAYAEYLDRNNIDWLYEPYIFDLGKTTYLPDFYLIKSRGFIEVKGYMRPESQKKIDLFREVYPGEWLEVLFREDLEGMGVKL